MCSSEPRALKRKQNKWAVASKLATSHLWKIFFFILIAMLWLICLRFQWSRVCAGVPGSGETSPGCLNWQGSAAVSHLAWKQRELQQSHQESPAHRHQVRVHRVNAVIPCTVCFFICMCPTSSSPVLAELGCFNNSFFGQKLAAHTLFPWPGA